MKRVDSSSESLEHPSPERSPEDELLSESKKADHCEDMEMVPPDGGWGWMVVLGSFIALFLGTFPTKAYSILFYQFLMSEGASSAKIAWIINFDSLIWSFYTLFIGPLSEEFGCRKVAIFGGVANFLSLFLSAFVRNPNYLFITFAVPQGIAGATSLALSMFIIAKYFRKRKGFALGITTVGSCLCHFAAPIVTNYLLENYGYKGASLILAAICLNQSVGGCLYQPVEWHMKPVETSNNDIIPMVKISTDKRELERMKNNETYDKSSQTESRNFIGDLKHTIESTSNLKEHKASTKLHKQRNSKSRLKFRRVLKSTYDNFKSLKYVRVQLIAWSYCGFIIGSLNFFLWIPFVVTNHGYSLEIGAWCSSVASIGDIIGRFVMSFLSDRKFFNVKYGYMFGIFLMGLITIVFSTVDDINVLMTLSCCWGLGSGFCFSLFAAFMIKVMGPKMFPAVLGVSSFCKGLVGIFIGVLVGVVRDATQSYTYALWMLGGFQLLIMCMLFLMPCAEKFDKWRYSEDNKKQML